MNGRDVVQKSDWSWLGWVVVAAGLRALCLEQKPLWTDEFATLVFSLGHSFRTIPLDQTLSWAQLLQPLRLDFAGPEAVGFGAGLVAVSQHLLAESTHPPLYFWLAHLWMRFWATVCDTGPWVNLTVARSLPALLGVVAVPASYWLTRQLTRPPISWQLSRRAGNIAAALMAMSPLAIYLSQDARHYTLAMLWILASLSCFVRALADWQACRPMPKRWAIAWIGANGLGFATHYFVGLVLAAQLLVLLIFRVKRRSAPIGWGIVGAIAGSLACVLPWVVVLRRSQDSELTHWAYAGGRSVLDWLMPLVNTLISNLTMGVMLPVQNVPTLVAIAAGLISLMLGLWGAGQAGAGWRHSLRQCSLPWAWWGLVGVWLGAIALFLGLDYGLGMQLTSAYRYSFIYLPVVVLLAAWGLAQRSPHKVLLILAVTLLSGLTVAMNLGYQKVHRPELVARAIAQHSHQSGSGQSALIAIAHRTHGHTGRLMGVAWELQRLGSSSSVLVNPQFYLDHQTCTAPDCFRVSAQLKSQLALSPQPRDLWLLNYPGTPTIPHCHFDATLGTGRVDGYRYQHFRCNALESS